MPKFFVTLRGFLKDAYLSRTGSPTTTTIHGDERDRQLLVEAAHALNHFEDLRTQLDYAAKLLVKLDAPPAALRSIDETLSASKI